MVGIWSNSVPYAPGNAPKVYGGLVFIRFAWILHGFLRALLALRSRAGRAASQAWSVDPTLVSAPGSYGDRLAYTLSRPKRWMLSA